MLLQAGDLFDPSEGCLRAIATFSVTLSPLLMSFVLRV